MEVSGNFTTKKNNLNLHYIARSLRKKLQNLKSLTKMKTQW